jgi:hypothetical protein
MTSFNLPRQAAVCGCAVAGLPLPGSDPIGDRQARSALSWLRQSGKNELQAQIEAYLLKAFCEDYGELVKVSPTWKPQSLNAMRRLERTLRRNRFTRDRWEKEQGYIYRLGGARIYFLSGATTSNIVGATARTLLEWISQMWKLKNGIARSSRWLPHITPRVYFGAPPGLLIPCWGASCAFPARLSKKMVSAAHFW